MRIVFFGASKFVIPLLDVLKNNYQLSLVVTTESHSNEPVSQYSKENSIELLPIKEFSNETIGKIHQLNAPVGVLAYFGLILPQTVLNLFPKGIINIHPSLLPKYRGPTPGQAAILNGDSQTGVTLIKLDEDVDHGPILIQATDAILPTDTAETLYKQLFQRGAELLNTNLNGYVKGEKKLIPQDHTKATLTQHLTRDSGYFDVQNPPEKEKLDRMIRAYYPWPGVWTKVVLRTHLDKGASFQKEKIIKFLPGEKLQVEGKKPMSYKDFINGYPEGKQIIEELNSSNRQHSDF